VAGQQVSFFMQQVDSTGTNTICSFTSAINATIIPNITSSVLGYDGLGKYEVDIIANIAGNYTIFLMMDPAPVNGTATFQQVPGGVFNLTFVPGKFDSK
jgi:hypothetical protein